VAITNPDGTAEGDYSYLWVQSTGVTAALSSTTAAHPTYIIPTQTNGTTACVSGTGATGCPEYKVTVTKTNTGKASAQSATLANYASTLATRPVANAGSAQGVKVAAPVTLDGSASTQAQGHPISYAWSQTGGPAVSLSSTTAQQPTFTAQSSPTSYTFSLTVTDTQNGVAGSGTSGKTSTASTVIITVSDYASPAVNAGSPQSVHVLDPVQLSGSASQGDGHTLVNTWSQVNGAPVTLSSTHALNPTFTAPASPSSLQFQLSSTDTQNPNSAAATTTSTVTITVAAFDPPNANAGPDQAGVRSSGHVTLNGSGSSDPDGFPLTYSWLQTSGPTVTLSNAHAAKPTFVAPVNPSTLSFQLTVDNGFFSGTASDSVSISVAGTPGLDFAATTTLKRKNGVQGQLASDAIQVNVTNPGQFTETLTTGMVSATVTVNGVDKSSDVVIKSRPSVVLPPGQSALYTLTWTHGDTLNIGDAVVISGCVAYPGDGAPGNNCSVVQQPAVPIDVAVSKVTLPKIRQAGTSTAITVAVKNNGSEEVSPLRPGQVVVTVTVGSGAPVTLSTPGGEKLVDAGKTTNYKFTWNHGSIPVGTNVSVTATVNITGNTSASSTNGASGVSVL
jgi:hypothetical protein